MDTTVADLQDDRELTPYRPSWINRLLGAFHKLPIPFLALCGVIWLVLAGIGHLSAWYNHIIPWRTLDTRILLVTLWTPYCLGLIDYLNRAASQALDDFRPALNMTEVEFAKLRYEFTVLPAGHVIAVNLLGVALTLASALGVPETATPFIATTSAAMVNLVIASLGIVFSITAIYQTLRQLRLTRHTYQCASRLNLLQASQLYAFSTLTVRIGIGWMIILYSGVVAFPALLDNPYWVGTSALLVLGIAGSFLATLSDIHRRISVDKRRQLDEVHALLQEVFSTLNRRVQGHQIEDLASLREAAVALDLERAVLSKVPTWPWQPGTIASFVTALMLPVIVWLVQALITRLMGL